MRIFLLLGSLLLSSSFITHLRAQCDPYPLHSGPITVLALDSENPNQPFELALDGDSLTFFRTNGNEPFPHEVWLDLGSTQRLRGLDILSRQDNDQGKLGAFELYLSQDTAQWGIPVASSRFWYQSSTDRATKAIRHGAKEARYLRLLALSNEDPSNLHRWLMAELEVLVDSCTNPITQAHQTIDFAVDEKLRTDQGPYPLQAQASSNLPVSYEVLAGPATLDGSRLSLTGAEGKVVIRAYQAGDQQFYPGERIQVVEAINPAQHPPRICTRLTDSLPLQMYTFDPYPLTARAEIDHPELFSVDSMSLEIDGQRYRPRREGHQYTVNWQPSENRIHQVVWIAHGSHGLDQRDSTQLEVKRVSGSEQYQPLDHDVIQFGGVNSRWLTKTVILPQFQGCFRSIKANFWTECHNVSGGCVDWDRVAWVEIHAPDGQWVELIRYITPYCRGCTHQIDLTDYASLLQGEVNLRVFIDTWGTGGWDMNLTLDYELGIPRLPYSKIDVLWKGPYSFGDPANLQPVPNQNIAFYENAATSRLHLFTTGHGWGPNNTQNAAEFYPAVHSLEVDGVPTFTQSLWTDCNPNPDGCQPQAGTWEFHRAGWCPGAIANRYEYDFSPFLSDTVIDLAYQFDPRYRDVCHPNNPACVTGQTCDDCNAGYNPFFQVSGNLISHFQSIEADTPLSVTQVSSGVSSQFHFELIPNPVNAGKSFRLSLPELPGPVKVTVLNPLGQVMANYPFKSVAEAMQTPITTQGLGAGVFLIQVQQNGQQAVKLLRTD
ncbi:MAG: peptide-N-glycosidase F-related protein [Bacteroidota bacterium]